MMKRMKVLALLVVLALLTGACSVNGTTPGTTKSNEGTTGPTTGQTTRPSGDVSLNAINLMSAVKGAQRPAVPEMPDAKYRQALNRFSAELMQAVSGNKGNLMVSPASVYLALAMTMNGAEGETREAMLQALADKGLSLEQVNRYSRDLMTLLTRTGPKTSLTIANSIWFDQFFTPYKPFLQDNADFFGADARKLDFKDKATIDTINRWVEAATNGTIDSILDQIHPDAVLYLINAIYFKSDWQVPFEKIDTVNRLFRAPAGDIETPFMHRVGTMSVLDAPHATGVMLPYDDGRFGYFALMPDEGLTPRAWLEKQDKSALFSDINRWIEQRSNEAVSLAMPKFESTFEDSLNDELVDIGLGIAFDPGQADFSRMNESHEKNLFIGEVRHKTFIRVDEKGTEAAAVTSVEMRMTSMPSVDKVLTFDRPFLYGIMDLQTGMPLFVGILESP